MGAAPHFFVCPVARRNPVQTSEYDYHRSAPPTRAWRVSSKGHNIVRTGRSRPNPSNRRGPRTLDESHEYECSCGHRGWSTHVDVLRKPVRP